MARLFTDQQLDALEIRHFIFHVLRPEDDAPQLLKEVKLSNKHLAFFKDQFRMASQHAGEFEFTSQNHEFVEQARSLLSGIDETGFWRISTELSTRFHDQHRGNMSSGIFIVAVVALPSGGDHVFLIKLDHKDVLNFRMTQSAQLAEVVLESVTNPIVQSPDAIQKVAIVGWEGPGEVDPDTGEIADPVWHLRASDRSTGKRTELTQYFAKFLHMKPKMTDEIWTSQTIKEVDRWADEHRDELSASVTDINERVAAYVETSPVFETEDFVGHVLQGEEEEKRKDLEISLFEALDSKGIAKTAYIPQLKEARRRLTTADGVTISWVGSMESKFIEIFPPEETGDGTYHIRIRTDEITWRS